jgi:hypothetical protein
MFGVFFFIINLGIVFKFHVSYLQCRLNAILFYFIGIFRLRKGDFVHKIVYRITYMTLCIPVGF